MKIWFEFEEHWDALAITPLLGVCYVGCANQRCDAQHWSVMVSWLFWSGAMVVSFDCKGD